MRLRRNHSYFKYLYLISPTDNFISSGNLSFNFFGESKEEVLFYHIDSNILKSLLAKKTESFNT